MRTQQPPVTRHFVFLPDIAARISIPPAASLMFSLTGSQVVGIELSSTEVCAKGYYANRLNTVRPVIQQKKVHQREPAPLRLQTGHFVIISRNPAAYSLNIVLFYCS